MNSNKVIVSGKNATTSVFITISESQKEQAERLEYEIRNSCTSTEEEEEAENNQYKIKKLWTQSKYCDECGLSKLDECTCDDESDDESDFENEHDEIKHLKVVEVLKNELEETKKQLKQKDSDAFTLKTTIETRDKSIKSIVDEKSTLYDEIQQLKKQLKQKDSDAFTLKTTIEARDKSIKSIVDEKSTLYDEIQQLKKQLKEVSEEADMAVHNHSVDAKALFKEIGINNKLEEENKSLKQIIRGLHVSLSKMTKQYNKRTTELKDERIFRRDNEDNFFRLLDKYNRCEKALKKVTV
jgi:chromosome segregation ATPase